MVGQYDFIIISFVNINLFIDILSLKRELFQWICNINANDIAKCRKLFWLSSGECSGGKMKIWNYNPRLLWKLYTNLLAALLRHDIIQAKFIDQNSIVKLGYACASVVYIYVHGYMQNFASYFLKCNLKMYQGLTLSPCLNQDMYVLSKYAPYIFNMIKFVNEAYLKYFKRGVYGLYSNGFSVEIMLYMWFQAILIFFFKLS